MAEWKELQLAENKYTDAEAISAMGAKADTNALNHDKMLGLGFRAHQSTAQSIPAYAFTVAVCEIEDYDVGNAYNTTTGKYTPQTAGYYIVQGNAVFNELADGIQFMTTIAKNGTNIVLDRGCTGALALGGGCVSTVINMNGSTDYLELKVYHKSSSSILLNTSSGYVVFSGWLLPAP